MWRLANMGWRDKSPDIAGRAERHTTQQAGSEDTDTSNSSHSLTQWQQARSKEERSSNETADDRIRVEAGLVGWTGVELSAGELRRGGVS